MSALSGASAWSPPNRARLMGCILALMSGVIGFSVLAGGDVGASVGACVQKLVLAGWAPGLYLLSAWGLGWGLARALWKHAQHPPRLALGLAALLTLTHAMAWGGAFSPDARGTALAWASLAPGLGLTAFALVRLARKNPTTQSLAPLRASWLASAVWIPMGMLLAAACASPGVLWASEFGGYDALSYHLALPQEWAAQRALVPSTTNVYSWLPSSIEAAFLHVGTLFGMHGAGSLDTQSAFRPWSFGLLSHDGQGVIAAQLLHAMIAIAACWSIGAATRGLVLCLGGSPRGAEAARLLTTALAAVTPWTLVVGSLAYNEMAMVLLLAGAMRIALKEPAEQRAGTDWREDAMRWILVAALIGAACGAKPTALVLGGVPILLVLLHATPWRRLPAALLAGAIVGALMLAPWMIRNAHLSGNPVFPFAAGLFPNDQGGTGDWTREQVERFHASHVFQGSWGQRLRLAVFPDTADPMGTSWRGLTNPQWGVFFLAAALAMIWVAWRFVTSRRRTALGPARDPATLLMLVSAGVLAQVALWLAITHVQSRFLLPVLVSGAMVVGTVWALLATRGPHPGNADASMRLPALARVLAMVVLACQTAFLVRTIRGHAGVAGAALAAWPADWMGRSLAEHIANGGTIPATEELSPEQWVNVRIRSGQRVLLIGDATPLYYRAGARSVTTWDTHPMAEIMASAPADPAAWSGMLRSRGFTLAIINFAELDRLSRSGFLDPRLNQRAITAWAQQHTTVLVVWERRGVVAVFLGPASDLDARALFGPDAGSAATPGISPRGVRP